MRKTGDSTSLVNYYRDSLFNPVPISVEQPDVWRAHCAKRRTLYEDHLGIPLGLLRDKLVVEFGANSGENAIVLARAGAQLTLVEPNQQSTPRLLALFEQFGVATQLTRLENCGISEFEPPAKYDLAIAEGFLYTLPDRAQLIGKLADMLRPGGIGVVSFNCQFGGLIEFVKRFVLWRACALQGIEPQDDASLQLALRLFKDDYDRLNASRPFDAWWKDTLVSPFYRAPHLWSFLELIPLIEAAGCRFLASSPQWNLAGHFAWYKNSMDTAVWHARVLASWEESFQYVLTGERALVGGGKPARRSVVESAATLVDQISSYTARPRSASEEPGVIYPLELEAYLGTSGQPRVHRLNEDLRRVIGAGASLDIDILVDAYAHTTSLKRAWGTAYHYLAFVRA